VPKVGRVVETSVYSKDLTKSLAFYEDLFGFPRLVMDPRLCALDVNGQSVLLLFQIGASVNPVPTPGGTIPGTDGKGPSHFAFAIDKAELEPWEQHLQQHGIAVESRVHWPLGGDSIYFRDPDGNSVELVTPGCWATY